MSESCHKQLNNMVNMPKLGYLLVSKENLMLSLAGAIVASLGFMYNDYSVILGSMLISPMGQPIIQSVLSILLQKTSGIKSGLFSLIFLTGCVVIVGFLMGQLNQYYKYYQVPTDKMEQLTSDEFLKTNFLIGCFTGFFVAYSRVYNNIGVLHGFSLVVSLLPPMTNSGLYASLAYSTRKNNPEDVELFEKYKKKSINSFKIAYANVFGFAISILLGFWVFCR